MTNTRSRSPVRRGRQDSEPHLQWRLDGAATTPEAPLILALHGWGMDEDFFALLLQRAFDRPMRFVFARAPFPADAGLGARHGGSWYSYDGNQERFRDELERIEAELPAFVESVETELGIAPAKRYVLGFSQGGYCGSWTALRRSDLFHGMIVVGARVKTEWLADEMRDAAQRGFRALICHGERDRSVKPEAAERSRADLAAAGVDVELRTFDAGHSIGRTQVAAIAEWLDAGERA